MATAGTITIRGENVSLRNYAVNADGTGTDGNVTIQAGRDNDADGNIVTNAADDNDDTAEIFGATLNLDAAGNIGDLAGGDEQVEFIATTAINAEADGTIYLQTTTDATAVNEIFNIGLINADGDGDGTLSNVTLVSDSSFVDVEGSANSDISGAAVLTMTAVDGIGAAGTNPAIEFDATSVTATNSTTGGIFLNGTGVGGVTFTNVANTPAGGIELRTQEDATLTNVQTGAANITVDVTEGNLTVSDTAFDNTGAGVITLRTFDNADRGRWRHRYRFGDQQQHHRLCGRCFKRCGLKRRLCFYQRNRHKPVGR